VVERFPSRVGTMQYANTPRTPTKASQFELDAKMEDMVVGEQGLWEGRMPNARSGDLDAGRKVTSDGEDVGRLVEKLPTKLTLWVHSAHSR
jgi:hypothetical protein